MPTESTIEKHDEKIFNINIRIERYRENFKLYNLKEIPIGWGAYVIKHPEGIYIGSSSAERGLRGRIGMYKWKEFENISYYVTESEIDALILEHILIKELKPELNVNGNRTGKRLKDGRLFSSGRICKPRYSTNEEEDDHFIPLSPEEREKREKERLLNDEEYRLEKEFIHNYVANERENVKNYLVQTKPDIFYNERGQFRQKVLISGKIRVCKILNRKISEVYDDDKKVYLPYDLFLRQQGEYKIRPIMP